MLFCLVIKFIFRIFAPMGKRTEVKIGQMFGYYKVISDEIHMVKNKNNNHHRGHLRVVCTLCNTEHLKRPDSLKSDSKKCRACSNKEKYLKNVKDKVISHKGYSVGHQGTGDLTKVQLYRIKVGCNIRNKEWDNDYMTTDNLWNLMIEQDHKCKLSGVDISLSKGENVPMITDKSNLDYSGWNASLDRIDSSKGYIKGNVQWVHRHVNIMKNVYSQDYFISLCEKIANQANQQPS